MSTNDETQNTTNMTDMSVDDDRDTTWMDTNRRGQIVYRPRRFRGLTGREGFADYVEQAYWVARDLGLLEEMAALPSLEGKPVTEIAGLTRALGARIRERMWTFHDGYGPNLYYGALTRMVAAAKEDLSQMTAAMSATLTEAQAAVSAWENAAAASPMPALPTSPLLRQSGTVGAAAAAVSDSEIELGAGALAVQTLLAARIASATVTGWSDISGGRPGVTGGGGGFIRAVPGFADSVKGPPLPLVADDDRHSDEDSASVENDDDGHEVTGTVSDGDEEAGGDGDEEADADGDEEADADGDEEGGADGNEADTEGAQPVLPPPRRQPAPLHQNIAVELPLWLWLAILAVFVSWAALVNGILCRDLGCRPLGR